MRTGLAFGVFLLYVCQCAAEDVADWTALRESGIKAYAGAELTEALAAFQNCWPLARTPIARAATAMDLGNVLHRLGRDKEARSWYGRAVETWKSIPNQADNVAQASLGLSDTERGLSDFKGSERTFRDAIEVKPSVRYGAELRIRLADLMHDEGRNDDARALLEEALALPGLPRLNKIDALLGVADLDRQTMRWSDSMTGWNKTLSLAREEHSVRFEALALRGMGLTALNRGDLSQAESMLRRSLELFESHSELPPRQFANALHCIAAVYSATNRYGLAESALLRALAIVTKEAGSEHPQSAAVMELLAEVYAAQKQFAPARQYAEHAYSIMRVTFGENTMAAADALGTVATVEQASHDLPAAAAHLEQSLEVARSSQAVSDQRMITLMSRYLAVLREMHRTREANRVQAEIKTFRLR